MASQDLLSFCLPKPKWSQLFSFGGKNWKEMWSDAKNKAHAWCSSQLELTVDLMKSNISHKLQSKDW